MAGLERTPINIGATERQPFYTPSVLTVEQDSVHSTLLEDVLRGLPHGEFCRAANAEEALNMVRERQGEYDIVILMSGRSNQAGMELPDFTRQLQEIDPTAVPALMTSGDLGGISGVPSREELYAMGIRHIFERQVTKRVADMQAFFNDLKMASWRRKQPHPSST